MSTQFTFDGHILSELSSQIPSDIFALNELIKNSYDAMANTINIALNTQNKTLTITDDGKGMGQEEISELLHISHSSKKYGTLNNNRYIQGSKGLGALSALRFGTQVTWTTRKNNIETNLTINRDDAIKNENLTDYKIPIETKETHDKHGTSITMQLTDDIQQTLEDELRNPLISSRIVYAFLPKTETRRDNPNDVDIQILINRETIVQRYYPALDIASIMPNRQRAEITYNSTYNSEETNTASIIRNGTEIKRIPLDPIPSDDFAVHLHLVYFKLDGIKNKERETIPPLFKTEKRTTTPQIFINENLFDSPDLFDPEINRRVKGGQSVSNFIGYVCINSDKVIFNPDRTQLSETPLNKKIKDFLASINSQLQREVAKFLPMEETSGNTSEPTVADNLNTPETAAKNIGTINDTKINGDNTQTADAPDNSSVRRKQSEEKPLLLHNFGNPIKPLHIKSEELKYPLVNLVNQINDLGKKGTYELIACGLRLFFDVPLTKLRGYEGQSKEVKRLLDDVKEYEEHENKGKQLSQHLIIKRILDNLHVDGNTPNSSEPSESMLEPKEAGALRRQISTSLKMSNKFELKNNLSQAESIAHNAEFSNLGSHRSTIYLTEKSIEDIANSASLFTSIVDALLQIP